MMQIRTTLWERLARVILWALLVVLPLLLYLLVACGDIVALGPLRGDASAVLLSFGWPMLLGGLATMFLLLLVWLGGRYAGWVAIRSLTASELTRPVVMGLGAYLLGCLVHWLLPPILLYCFTFMPPSPYYEPDYWWPFSEFFSGDVPAGWTLFPPLSAVQFRGYALVPPVEAACVKLGALLATLLTYRLARRDSTAQPKSAESI